jgi:hypothetical protein
MAILILKYGQENGNAAFTKTSVYYSFTLPPAQSGSPVPPRILPDCVRGASLAFRGRRGTGKWLKMAPNPLAAINAFLTLSAVTKW